MLQRWQLGSVLGAGGKSEMNGAGLVAWKPNSRGDILEHRRGYISSMPDFHRLTWAIADQLPSQPQMRGAR